MNNPNPQQPAKAQVPPPQASKNLKARTWQADNLIGLSANPFRPLKTQSS